MRFDVTCRQWGMQAERGHHRGNAVYLYSQSKGIGPWGSLQGRSCPERRSRADHCSTAACIYLL